MREYVKAGYVNAGYLGRMTEADAKKLTHINIAFGHCKNSRATFEPVDETAEAIKKIRLWHPEIRVLLSIGGWGAGGFSPMAATAETRAEFAVTSAELMEKLGLDGIDIDWEYPCVGSGIIEESPDDKHNFTLMLAELRRAVSAVKTPSGCSPILTIAAGADRRYVDNTEMKEVAELLDYVSLMTYDMRGTWTNHAGHHTNLRSPSEEDFASAEYAVEVFVNAGVPAEKLVIGAAFYSRKWEGLTDDEAHGYGKASRNGGGFGPSYGEIREKMLGSDGWTEYWDDTSKAPWLFNGDTFISYDNEHSIAEKCAYVKSRGLLGIMYWEHSCDPSGTLLGAIDSALL